MKKLFIHIGAPKCASSSLQNFFYNQEVSEKLNALGISFPSNIAGKNNFTDFIEGNGRFLHDEIANGIIDDKFPITLKKLNSIDSHKIVISDEALYAIISPLLRSNCLSEKYETSIIISIREPSSWLLSDYYQFIKTGLYVKGFIQHTLDREIWLNWHDYILDLSKINKGYNIIVTDYKNLFSCMLEKLELDKNDFIRYFKK